MSKFVMNISSSFPADVIVDIPVAVAIPKVSWEIDIVLITNCVGN